MRTTVRLPDNLLDRARREAARRGTTLTALIEEGLREVLRRPAESPAARRRIAIPVCRAGGGLQPGVDLTDSAIIRCVVDDPEKARTLMHEHKFPFTESPVVVVEMDTPAELNRAMAALLEAELNINHLYSFIPHPRGKSIAALSMEDNEMGEQVLRQHQFQVLKQIDLAR